MTIEELANLVRRIKYKPDFELTFNGDFFPEEQIDRDFLMASEMHTMDPYHLNFKLHCIDADDPELKKVSFVQKNLKISKVFLSMHDEVSMVRFIHGQLRSLEAHECDEFFRLDGVKLFDPYAGRNR
jgi:hypothetical protein